MRRITLLTLLVLCTTVAAAQSLSDLKRLATKAKEVASSRRASPPAATTDAASTSADADSPAMPEGALMLWVERNFKKTDNPLHSELSINGRLVDIFTADTFEPVSQYFRDGWNTITLVTTAQEPSNDQNDLIFRIGPASRDAQSKKVVMSPVLWQFRNGTDWKLREDGTWRHALGPKVKKVQVDLQVYYAGLAGENRELEEGDLVLIAKPNFDSQWNSSVSGTVFVNGTAITTFLQPTRQIVITPYLKKGKNEIRLVSARVKNGYVDDNDLSFTVAGPARWSATEDKWVLKPLLQFKAMQGWTRDAMSGQLINRADPKADTIERVIPLLIKDSEQPAGE